MCNVFALTPDPLSAGPRACSTAPPEPPGSDAAPHAFGVAAPTACHVAHVGKTPGWLTSGQPCDTRFAVSSRMVEMGVCICSEVFWGGDVRHVGGPMKEYFRLQMVLPGFDAACPARADLDCPQRAAGRRFYDALRSTTGYEKDHRITNLSVLTLLIYGWMALVSLARRLRHWADIWMNRDRLQAIPGIVDNARRSLRQTLVQAVTLFADANNDSMSCPCTLYLLRREACLAKTLAPRTSQRACQNFSKVLCGASYRVLIEKIAS